MNSPGPNISVWEPTDPDVDLRAERAARHRRREARVLAVIAAGGAAGAVARFAISRAWPTTPGGFPAATFVINVAGCALIGALMVLVTDVWPRRRLVRPFLATGVLGGFTTFSSYTVDIQTLNAGHHADIALLYTLSTALAALAAVWATAVATRRLVTRRTR